MASTIISRTISAVVDKRINMSASQFSRTISIGSSWTTLRLGVRWSFVDNGSGLVGTPRLAMGVCSGTSNCFGDATTTNFCGYVSNYSTWARNTEPSLHPGNFGTAAVASRRVGTTLTFSSSALTGFYIFDATTIAQRQMQFVTITKGSPNYTFDFFQRDVAGATDVSSAQFLAQMESTVPSFSNYTNTTGHLLAVDEVAGAFDSVNVSWDRTAVTMEIHDWAVARFA